MTDAKPAWALAALFGVWYLLGTAIENWLVIAPVLFAGLLLCWIAGVLLDVLGVGIWVRSRLILRRQRRSRRRPDPHLH